MILYGMASVVPDTIGPFSKTPLAWCSNKGHASKYSNLLDPDSKQFELGKDSYRLYKLNIDFINTKQVMDLRGDNWKEKLTTFVSLYGNYWVHKGGMWKDSSPIKYILHYTNYSILDELKYKWVTFVDRIHENAEIWYYISTKYCIEDLYEVEPI